MVCDFCGEDIPEEEMADHLENHLAQEAQESIYREEMRAEENRQRWNKFLEDQQVDEENRQRRITRNEEEQE